MEKFFLGLALGMAGGAVIVANNCKLRQAIKRSQEDLMQKAEDYIDQKMQDMSSSQGTCSCDQQQTQEQTE